MCQECRQFKYEDLTFLGSGSFRKVYLSDCGTKVYKVLRNKHDDLQNREQFNVWQAVKDTEFAKYFPRVEFLSRCGKILVCQYIKGETLWDLQEKDNAIDLAKLFLSRANEIAEKIQMNLGIELDDIRTSNIIYNEEIQSIVLIDCFKYSIRY